MSELVIAGGPTHLDTFDLADGSGAMMLAGVVRLDLCTLEYQQQPDILCPVKRYMVGIAGSVRIIEHPDATMAEIERAITKARVRLLGWTPIL